MTMRRHRDYFVPFLLLCVVALVSLARVAVAQAPGVALPTFDAKTWAPIVQQIVAMVAAAYVPAKRFGRTLRAIMRRLDVIEWHLGIVHEKPEHFDGGAGVPAPSYSPMQRDTSHTHTDG